jgi:hypothetical protein
VELVCVIKLLKKFSKAACGKIRISNTVINDINQLLRVLKLLSAPCVHLFVFLLQRLYFEVIKLIFPSIRPALPFSIPNSWAGLRLTVFHTRDVNFTIN